MSVRTFISILGILLVLTGTSDVHALSVINERSLEIMPSHVNLPKMVAAPGAKNVRFLSVDVMASCDSDRVIESMIVMVDHAGATGGFPTLRAVNGSKNLTASVTINPRDLAALLKFEPAFRIPACETYTIDIVGDMPSAAAQGSRHSVYIEFASDIVSDADSLNGQFPVQGGVVTVKPDATGKRACMREARQQQTLHARSDARAACRRI